MNIQLSTLNTQVLTTNGPISECRTTANYNTNTAIRTAINDLKFKGKRENAQALGRRLFAEYTRAAWQVDMIAAVPLALSRLREREYNQAALLADELGKLAGVPFYGEALRQVRETRPQSGLQAIQRHANVAGAFTAEPALVNRQTVLLVDDMSTTGETLVACTKALLKAGARSVYALTVAAVPSKPDPVIRSRRASIRIVTEKRTGNRYAQLVFPNGRSRSLGLFNAATHAPLLDHVLMLAYNDPLLTVKDLKALIEANKSLRL